MSRKYIDCRAFPSTRNCSVAISADFRPIRSPWVAKDGGSDWAGDKTDEEHRIRLQRAGRGSDWGKYSLAKTKPVTMP